jgi:hypothetical protein
VKRLLPVLGALALVGAVVAVVVWQRQSAAPPAPPALDSTQRPGAVCRNDVHELDPNVANGVQGQIGHAWTVGYTGCMAITALVDDVKASQPVEDDGLSRTIWQKFAERV